MTGHQVEQAVELPNWITVLEHRFPDSSLLQFLAHWENIFFSLLAAGLIGFVAVSAARKKALVPRGIQNFFELIVETFEGFACGILGPEHGPKHVPYIGTVFFYILCMNWMGLVPLLKSPTSAWSTTLALALATMVYIQITGIREQGIWHYLKHLAGNPVNIFGIVLIPLMLVLNIILEIGAVPFSLSLRLFANISSEDRLLLTFAEIVLGSKYLAFPFQLFANILAIVFSIIQAFVFTLLATVYIALVLPHDDPVHGVDSSAGAPGAHAH
ncbi:MAG: F0F1 ATP synthase subunit A [Candidatus Omnitrophota bacterium]|jgi:F-type H+-transporting ATPase subunit a